MTEQQTETKPMAEPATPEPATPEPATPEPATPEPATEEVVRREPWAGWDVVVRVAGVTVAIVATVVTALIEIELSALRVGGFAELFAGRSPWTGSGAAVPLAILVAVGANLLISWFAVTTTGRRWALGPPWALWTLLMLAAAGTRTAEGDYLIGGKNWVAVVMILVGSLTFAVYSYRMILKSAPPRRTDSRLSGSI
ncbi:hypothetical protein [Actinoplanes sp. GCM10030250]|uniref:hypothetical protein n=1 Tax=Actinoplanes sp. GCM10030250 TaxID=3273376 RepID=UPI00360CBABA